MIVVAKWLHFSIHQRVVGIVEGDIMRFLEEFLSHGVLPRGTNLSFISLIAKCDVILKG